MTGYTEESRGVRSSKRIQAISCMVAAFALFGEAGYKESKYAFLGGVACLVASIVLPLITTYKELKETLIAAKDIANGAKP